MPREAASRIVIGAVLSISLTGCNSMLFPNNFESGFATAVLVALAVYFFIKLGK